MKRGEIWVAALAPHQGKEVGKQRPVLVVQTDLLNQVNHPTVIILPISSKIQPENALRFRIEHSLLTKGFGYVLIDQPRAIDAESRLKKCLGKVKLRELREIDLHLKQVFDLV